MAEVKRGLPEALEQVEELLATELVGVVKDLVSISHDCEDPRARVSAAVKLIDMAKPPKVAPALIINNMPTVVSALELPPGSDHPRHGLNPKAVELLPEKPKAPKILPESNPLHRTTFRGAFTAESPVQPAAPAFAAPAPRTAKFRTPGAPAKPPAASSISQLPVERQPRGPK